VTSRTWPDEKSTSAAFHFAKALWFSSLIERSVEESRAITANRTPIRSSNKPLRPLISISL
jgi:hypothetical protein